MEKIIKHQTRLTASHEYFSLLKREISSVVPGLRQGTGEWRLRSQYGNLNSDETVETVIWKV